MDIHRVISDLRLERARLDGIIKALESLSAEDSPGPRRRGRKFMDDGDRKQVSERMKRYWEQRRSQPPVGPDSSNDRISTASA
jgi:hypothetical protein